MKLYMKILVLSASIIISSLYTNVTLSLSLSPICRCWFILRYTEYRCRYTLRHIDIQLSSAAKNIDNAGYNNGTRGE